MPRFHLNLRHGTYLFADEHGAEFADLRAARRGAMEAARDLIHEHPEAQDWAACRFEITDPGDAHLATVEFAPLARPATPTRREARPVAQERPSA